MGGTSSSKCKEGTHWYGSSTGEIEDGYEITDNKCINSSGKIVYCMDDDHVANSAHIKANCLSDKEIEKAAKVADKAKKDADKAKKDAANSLANAEQARKEAERAKLVSDAANAKARANKSNANAAANAAKARAATAAANKANAEAAATAARAKVAAAKAAEKAAASKRAWDAYITASKNRVALAKIKADEAEAIKRKHDLEESYWHKPPEWHDDTMKGFNPAYKTKKFVNKYNMQCPKGAYIDRIYRSTGSHINNLGFRCSDDSKHYLRKVAFKPWATDVFDNGITEVPNYKMYPNAGLRAIFKSVGGTTPFSCPGGTKLTGMRGKYGNYVGNVEFQCQPFTNNGNTNNG